MEENSEKKDRDTGPGDNTPSPQPNKQWVQFNNDEEEGGDGRNAAVLETSVEVVQSAAPKLQAKPKILTTVPSTGLPPDNLQNVELRNSPPRFQNSNQSTGQSQNGGTGMQRRTNAGFVNGEVIVSILPMNTKWPWVTPASFRPELVPEELMVPGLTLTVEEFVLAMEQLTTDFRFNAYTICYKRLLATWLSSAFLILLIILFSGVVGIGLFALGISWLIINACAVFLCMYIKIKINQGLERCLAKVNRTLIKHKLILGLDDRGRISCHKVHLCFIYFDPTDCVKRLEEILAAAENRSQIQSQLDVNDLEIVITGAQNTRRLPVKDRGETIFLRYVQRWAKDYLRRRLDWTVGEGSENPSAPRHLTSALCPCQYVQEYLRHKPMIMNQNECSWWFPCFPSSTTSGEASNPPPNRHLP